MNTDKKTAVALGCFDGLHKGHISVITCALSFKERGFVPLVLLFDAHPLLSLTGSAPTELLQPAERDGIIAAMGAEKHIISFDSLKNLSPRDFVENILIGSLNAGAVCCGWNFRFGKGNSGSCDVLEALCAEYGIELCISQPVIEGEDPVSSSRIRQAAAEGNIPLMNRMLGREFGYKYTVVDGSKRGRLMDAPTINQYFDKNFTVPRHGVYASFTVIGDKKYPSVTNIGLRPSFENEDLRSETYIIGFCGDLYGKDIEVRLLEYLRGEMKFDDLDMLRRQIRTDAVNSQKIFEERGGRIV